MSTYFNKYKALTKEKVQYKKCTYQPKTDLHTHFAGILSGKNLINIGKKHNILFPAKLLQEMGIDISINQKEIDINSLTYDELEILEKHLSIPVNKQVRFSHSNFCLENIYSYRQVFHKNYNILPDIIEEICSTYNKMGVKYTEISGSFIYDLENSQQPFKIIVESLEHLEKKYDIKVRFLAAMNRQDDLEWSLDNLEKIKKIAFNKYIAGIDVVGHENCSNKDFNKNIEPYMEFSKKNNLNWTFRFHAGENPSFPDNVREVAKLAIKHKAKIRIGHGLYGIDRETFEALKKSKAIIETNSTSNLSLNNIDHLKQLEPAISYIKQNIPMVVGTDGPGIYQTNPQDECEVIEHLLSSFNQPSYLKKLSIIEDQIINERQKIEKKLILKSQEIPSCEEFIKISKLYTPQVEVEKKKKIAKIKNEKLKSITKNNALYLEKEEIKNYFSHKIPFLIGGASKVGWANLTLDQQNNISTFIDDLYKKLDADKYYIITGGSDYGVENLIHIKNQTKKFDLLGILTADSDVSENKGINHFTILNQNLWGKFPYVMDNIIIPQNGKMVFIAGGAIVSDEILSSFYNNLKPTDLFLLSNCGGASEQKAKKKPEYAIKSIDDMFKKLQQNSLKI